MREEEKGARMDLICSRCEEPWDWGVIPEDIEDVSCEMQERGN